MRKILSISTLKESPNNREQNSSCIGTNGASVDNAIDSDQEQAMKRSNTSPKAEMMWRAIRILHEEGKNFSIPDILKLCDNISIDYVKKFLVYLYFRGITTRISLGIGKKPSIYALCKDERPDPLFVSPYMYRKLMRAKSSEITTEPAPISSDEDSKKADTKTNEKDTVTYILRDILRVYQEDLANKVQQLNFYVHRIGDEKRMDDKQEGFLLLDLIRDCLTLYFHKSAQVKYQEMIKKEEEHGRCH